MLLPIGASLSLRASRITPIRAGCDLCHQSNRLRFGTYTTASHNPIPIQGQLIQRSQVRFLLKICPLLQCSSRQPLHRSGEIPWYVFLPFYWDIHLFSVVSSQIAFQIRASPRLADPLPPEIRDPQKTPGPPRPVVKPGSGATLPSGSRNWYAIVCTTPRNSHNLTTKTPRWVWRRTKYALEASFACKSGLSLLLADANAL